jgi:hypothetical protein
MTPTFASADRKRLSGLGRMLLGSCISLLAFAPTYAVAKPTTLGFLVTTWDVAVQESRYVDECPHGFTAGNDEIWWRALSKADRSRLTKDGLIPRDERWNSSVHRGPNGEDVCVNPTLVNDPPMLTVQSQISRGMNLDGTDDGHATARTCAHEKFTTPEGVQGIDNQLYRLIGCTYGWRIRGQLQINANAQRKDSGYGMSLMEVTGVDDLKNDDDVQVTFYRSIDHYVLDSKGDFAPFASYRIDMAADGKPRYGKTLQGKILDGVLITEPGDLELPFFGNFTHMIQRFRDMRFRLELAADRRTGKGTAAGYFSVDQLVTYVSGLGGVAGTAAIDCPALYQAASRLADGFPDPKTGQCTDLSAAYDFQVVAAFVAHPEPTRTAQPEVLPLQRLLATLGVGDR